MKHSVITTTLVLALLLGHSCRAVKDRSTAQHIQVNHARKQTVVDWRHYDSTGRYWLYQGDSLFYYHPDQGLYGRGGRLTVVEDEVRQDRSLLSIDSLWYGRQEDRQTVSGTTFLGEIDRIGRYMLIALALGLIIFFLRKFIR